MTDLAPSITCPGCGATSWNPHDVAERYCGRCNRFHTDDGVMLPRALAPHIPITVDPFPGATVMASHEWASIRKLAARIIDLIDADKHVVLMAGVMSLGLMRAPWPMGWAIRRARRKLHISDFEAWALAFHRRPKASKSLAFATVRHMLKGKDREEAGSVGGFSTRELQAIANLVFLAEKEPA